MNNNEMMSLKNTNIQISRWNCFKKQLPLQMFVLVGIAYLLIFSFVPMVGLVMAFKNYDISMGPNGIFTSAWVGFDYFKEFFTDYNFNSLLKNTVCISLLKLVFTFPVPILFAIMINDVKFTPFKKFSQTASYLPHFISWVIISGIAFQFLSSNGVLNVFLMKLGFIKQPVSFLTSPDCFWGLAVLSDIWKEMGWWAIIFLAAITGISQDQYEAAQIDGAGRLKRTWYITLPGIKETIVIVLILALGNLFGGGLSGSNFEQSYLLGNSINNSTSDIIQTYVFRVGLSQGRYAYATAVGLIQSTISLILILMSNSFSKKFAKTSLY